MLALIVLVLLYHLGKLIFEWDYEAWGLRSTSFFLEWSQVLKTYAISFILFHLFIGIHLSSRLLILEEMLTKTMPVFLSRWLYWAGHIAVDIQMDLGCYVIFLQHLWAWRLHRSILSSCFSLILDFAQIVADLLLLQLLSMICEHFWSLNDVVDILGWWCTHFSFQLSIVVLHEEVRLGAVVESIKFEELLGLRAQLQIFETYRVLALDSVQVNVIAQCSQTLRVQEIHDLILVLLNPLYAVTIIWVVQLDVTGVIEAFVLWVCL